MLEQPDSPTASDAKKTVLCVSVASLMPLSLTFVCLTATIIYIDCKVSTIAPLMFHLNVLNVPTHLSDEIHTIIASESDYEERVKSLETDLVVFKRACFAAETEKRELNNEINALRDKLEALESHKKVRHPHYLRRKDSLIVCVLS